MNIFIFLFCILMNEVKSITRNVFPARIFIQQTILSENNNLYATCSTYGAKKNTTVYVYLCNNGTGVDRQVQKDERDITFTLQKVRPNNSGEYSCVFSPNKYEPSEVNGNGLNKIGIHVIANFQPADLSLSGPSSVKEGAQVEFVCSLPNVLQTLDDCGFVQSYLMRDKAIYQVQAFDVKLKEARFVIQDAVLKDSGQFSCVVRPSQCFKEDEERLTGNNAISLQVKAFPSGLTALLAVVAVVLLVAICLCAKWKRDVCTSRMKHANVNINTTELQDITGREEEPSDSQGREEEFSYSQDEEHSGYQNVVGENDPYSYVSDALPLYDEVLPSAGPSNENLAAPTYTQCKKR